MSQPSDHTDSAGLSAEERRLLGEGLDPLRASDALEERVLDRLRDEAHPPSHPRWRVLGLTALAASLLVALMVLLPAKSEVVPQEADGGEDAVADTTRAEMAPSAREVREARVNNLIPTRRSDFSDATNWVVIHRRGKRSTRRVGSIPGTLPKAQHAWLLRKESTRGPRHFTHGMLPPRGVMHLGRELLAELGITSSFEGHDLVMRDEAGRTLRCDARSSTIDLDIASPYDGGGRARVRALVSTAYSGTVALGPELGRALGLHLSEIPGGFTLGGSPTVQPMRGQRAYARVRIPAFGYDKVIEIQVREDDPPQALPEVEGLKGMLSITGPAPTAIFRASSAFMGGFGVSELVPEGTKAPPRAPGVFWVNRKQLGPGTSNASASQYQLLEAGTSALSIQFADVLLGISSPPPTGAEGSTILLGRCDIGHPEPHFTFIKTAWWEPKLRVAPRAHVITSRVWRGNTAVPSLEGVTIGRADAEGRIRLPRVAGEQGNILRIRVIPADGGMGEFVDVPLPYTFFESVRGVSPKKEGDTKPMGPWLPR